MVWDWVRQIKAAKPPVRQVQMYLFTQPPLRADAKAIPNQEHTDQQFGINRWAACVTVKLSQVLADIAQINKPINRTQQVILWNTIFQRELIKQRSLCFLLRSHHREIPHISARIESAKAPQINKSFSTELARRDRFCGVFELPVLPNPAAKFLTCATYIRNRLWMVLGMLRKGPFSRVRVWQIVKGVMIEAGIPGAPRRSPKGLRHGFGIYAIVHGIPLHLLQKWMGHARPLR